MLVGVDDIGVTAAIRLKGGAPAGLRRGPVLAHTDRNAPAKGVGCISDRICLGAVQDDNEPWTSEFAGAAFAGMRSMGEVQPNAVSWIPNVECVTINYRRVKIVTKRKKQPSDLLRQSATSRQ